MTDRVEKIIAHRDETQWALDWGGYIPDAAEALDPPAPEKTVRQSSLPPISSFKGLNSEKGHIFAQFNLKSGDVLDMDLTDVALVSANLTDDVRPAFENAIANIEADKKAYDQLMQSLGSRLGKISVP